MSNDDKDKNILISRTSKGKIVFLKHPDDPWYFDLFDALHYRINKYLNLRELYRRLIKWPWQRLTRGFDDRELWNLDMTIAKFVVPRLKEFLNYSGGWPHAMAEEETEFNIAGIEDLTPEEKWDKVLSEMLWAMEYASDNYGEDRDDYPFRDPEARKKLKDRYENGMRLFAEYFSAMWD